MTPQQANELLRLAILEVSECSSATARRVIATAALRRAPAPTEPAVDRDAVLYAALSALVESLAQSDDEGLIEHAPEMVNARKALSGSAQPLEAQSVMNDANFHSLVIAVHVAETELDKVGKTVAVYSAFEKASVARKALADYIDSRSAKAYAGLAVTVDTEKINEALGTPTSPVVPGECTEDMWFATTHIRNDIERADIEAMWRAMIAAAPSSPADPRLDDLSMLVRQLARALSKAAPGHELPAKAVDYLQRKGLQGSPLRDAAPEPALLAPYDALFKAIAAGTVIAGNAVSVSVKAFTAELAKQGYTVAPQVAQASQPTSAEGMTAWAAYCPAGFQFIHADQRVVEDFVYTRRYCGEGPYSIMHMKVSRPTSAEGKDSERLEGGAA